MSSLVLWTNNASSLLASGITNTATACTVTAGQGALFPSPGANQYCVATLEDTSGNIEVVWFTNRTSDTFTIVRAQEGTTALAWTAGDLFANLVTAGTLAAFQQASPPAATFNAPSIIAASGMPGAGTITISGTKANRYTVFASVLGTLTNSNGTPISPIVSITIRDGSTVLATITSNFQSSGVPTGYAGAIQFGGVVNVPAPVAGSTYTITATDTEGDGGSHSYANTMLTANAAALS